MASILKVDEIQSTTGGGVLQPTKPAFMVRWSSSQTGLSATGYNRLNFDDEVFDIGGNVPAGVYHFDLSLRFDSVGSGFLILSLSNHASTLDSSSDLFNTSYRIMGSPSSNFQSIETSVTIELPASYVVAPWYYNQTDTSYNLSTTGTHFSGYLVG